MPKKQNTGGNDSSILPYIVGGLVGAVGAGIVYLLAHANTESIQQTTSPSNRTSSTSNNSTYNNNSRCSICLRDLTSMPRILSCGHTFHESCISKWLNCRSFCPQCHTLIQ
ncbi:hypothetical protein FQA39_LY01018 [Lamprigera yunnana]|nr:hypothetical protein FQA39_LY01018 [Lamprigera yunnana]